MFVGQLFNKTKLACPSPSGLGWAVYAARFARKRSGCPYWQRYISRKLRCKEKF